VADGSHAANHSSGPHAEPSQAQFNAPWPASAMRRVHRSWACVRSDTA